MEQAQRHTKDLTDEQVAQWAIEESEKIKQMAEDAMDKIHKSHSEPGESGEKAKAYRWFFSGDFNRCCANDVRDLRTEILRRLGPPAKSPEEESRWKTMWNDDPFDHTVDPFSVKRYAPYMDLLGRKLKRRTKPRNAPKPLKFSTTQLPPDDRNAYRAIVTIETDVTLTAGYVVTEFEGEPPSLGCDFTDSTFPELEFVDYPELLKYLKSNPPRIYALKIGKTPFTHDKPVHVLVGAATPVRVSKVTLFDE